MAKVIDSNGSSRGLYLQWEGKKIYRQQVPTPRLLEPVEKYSFGTDPANLVIEGDNLRVLASLKPHYAGQIDVVYIDPPTTSAGTISGTATSGFMIPTPMTATRCTLQTKMADGTRSG